MAQLFDDSNLPQFRLKMVNELFPKAFKLIYKRKTQVERLVSVLKYAE